MLHRSTRDCVNDLRQGGLLLEVSEPLSANLEIAEIQRRVYANQGPALLFTNVIDSQFPMASNLFGSLEQARYLFRHTLDRVRRAIELKIDPQQLFQRPTRYWNMPWVAWNMLPKPVRSGKVLQNECSIDNLPPLKSWPMDGGPFVTLPQVLSQSPGARRCDGCNLGMYRIQLSGNEYVRNEEIGLHYQIHRGIGVHHQQALDAGVPFPVNVFVGGSPAMTLSAVMPLPEGISELTFAGALAGYRIPMVCRSTARGDFNHAPIYADADFCIVGEVDPNQRKPEGPFGDHLGYYSLQHDFPMLKIHRVYHRTDAIWPFTVVGRPPQEDTTFGQLIHEITGPIIPTVIPGVKAVHAVDAAGVHPLLLAIGSERYTPSRRVDRPQELLTQGNAILGQGQMSLAKYLMITDDPNGSLDIHDIGQFFRHVLERVDLTRDLHFQTRTTIDTLDYSGEGFNAGSKVVLAASGGVRRSLKGSLEGLKSFPAPWREVRLVMPGVLAVELPPHDSSLKIDRKELLRLWIKELEESQGGLTGWEGWQWISVVDDAHFAARSLQNFLWVTFTRSNPALDIFGMQEWIEDKHWGCNGPLVIDARIKKHHAPGLVEDAAVSAKIDALAARGGPISKYL